MRGVACAGSVSRDVGRLNLIVRRLRTMGILARIFRRRPRTITVTVYGDDASFDRRRALRDAVVNALTQTGLGEYLGGGTMVTSDEPHYSIEFGVSKERRALSVIRDILRSLGASSATEWSVGSTKPKRLFDE